MAKFTKIGLFIETDSENGQFHKGIITGSRYTVFQDSFGGHIYIENDLVKEIAAHIELHNGPSEGETIH